MSEQRTADSGTKQVADQDSLEQTSGNTEASVPEALAQSGGSAKVEVPTMQEPEAQSAGQTGATQNSAPQSGSRDNNRQRNRKDSLEDLCDLIVERATSAHPTLRAVLAGTVEIFVKDRPFRVVFDFVSNPPKKIPAGTKESDCIIECDEKTLLRIHNGDLNPQLVMVSDKMLIKGKSGLAVYFFNLLGD